MLIGRCLTLSIAVAFALPGLMGAQPATRVPGEEEGVATKGEWTIDDILLAESVEQYRIAPDGGWVVWVKTRVDEDKGGAASNLFLSSLSEDREVQLTRGNDSHSSPRWSPDGKLISFLSSRPLPEKKGEVASSQLWLIDPRGGEPWPITSFERGIQSYEWKDVNTILFLAQEDAGLYETETEKRKDTSRVVDDEEHEPPVRLFAYSIAEKQTTRLTHNNDRIASFALSPKGERIVSLHERSLSWQYDQRIPPVTYIWDLETGAGSQIFDGSRMVPRNVEWAKDGSGFYFLNDSTTHPRYREATINVIMYYDLAVAEATLVDLDWERGVSSNYAVTADGFVALLENGVRYKPARFTRRGDGWRRAWIEGDHSENITDLELGVDDRTLVYSHSAANVPTQLYRARISGSRIRDQVQVTHLNASYESKPKPRVEIVRWAGARDEEVEGVLYYPLDYEEGKKYPLILSIHGGPTGTDRDRWSQSYSTPILLLNQKGAFVLKANYHGSAAYGLDWVESICCGNYYSLEIPDLENGVDYLIDQGLVDPEKLGTMGWSNGAILSIELTTLNPRYKAASTGAGDVEWISDWANVDFGAAFDNYYFGAAPYEDPQRYIELSPFFRMKDVKTPTIIYFGTEDRNVPTDQGWSHFRALQQIGQVPVKFILFPGETHGIRKLAHQRRKVAEDLAWFDKYLFGTYEPENEAFKKESPLAEALKRAEIRSTDGRYGTLAQGKLIPEVVEYQGVELGRFEVTRAQFAEFDNSYSYEAGTENYPANGVAFDRARAYVAWLSELTGRPYRLITAAEAKAVYAGKGGENTLDYWAGYKPNPDDAARLATKIAELPGEAPLLKAVGSFPGRGDGALVFDLGGNVAEWVAGEDGRGKLMGGSADLPSDGKAQGRMAGVSYRGLRVALEREQ